MTDEERAAFEEILREKLKEIDGLEAQNTAATATVELDQQGVGRLSRMDAIERQAIALASRRRRIAERARIEAALKRLEEGEFGWCEECGEPIAPARLQLDPTARLCIGCAGARE